MRHESLVNEDWTSVVVRLGGAERLHVAARETKAFLRPREITNAVDLLYRLRQCGDWLALLVGQVLSDAAPQACHGRMIRIIDATTVPKKGPAARKKNELWRIHSAFDLPQERFGHFELTDQQAGETLDRIPVVAGEIRLADRAYLQPDRMAHLLDEGADFVIRSGWKSARWLDAS